MQVRIGWIFGLGFALASANFAAAGTDCGNAVCDTGEDTCSCPEDCPNDPFVCDPCDCGFDGGDPEGCYCDTLCLDIGDCCDNSCDECGLCPTACGNGICDVDEDNCLCADDCGNDPFACEPCECGSSGGGCYCDSICIEAGDCCSNACDACGQCPPVCGNGSCESGEDSCGCPEDCPDDPTSCSPCECNVDFSVAGDPGPACACDAGCVSRGDCCSNQCQVCGDCNGACCLTGGGGGVAGGGIPCVQTSEIDCLKGMGGTYLGDGTSCTASSCGTRGACCHEGKGSPICSIYSQGYCSDIGGSYLGDDTQCGPTSCVNTGRVDVVKKGSLLVFPAVELGWRETVVAGGGGAPVLTQDTILTLVNDFTKDVHVKLYFVNGDAPTEPIYADDLQQILLERGHNGWNQVDCTIELTENESTYLVMSSGVGGCQRFTILDPGTPPGRPSGEAGGGRVLRGFVIAFAVDENQNEISHNHLSGHADIINYELRSAWEYQAYSFQAINPSTGSWTDGQPGELSLDGVEYDYSFNTLLFDFYAVGSTAFSNDDIAVMLDTDLTLMPMDIDLRQDSCGPVTTKAHFDIWNANEDFRSGTTRCITCWDQTLLSAYSLNNGLDNNFILADLGTDKGKARIDGMASFECDNLFVPPDLDDAIQQWLLLHDRLCEENGDINVAGVGPPNGNHECCEYTINDSQYSSLLGVAAKILNFSGAASGTTWAGMNLVGAGQESAQIRFDVPAPPDTAVSDDSRATKNASERNTLSPARGEK